MMAPAAGNDFFEQKRPQKKSNMRTGALGGENNIRDLDNAFGSLIANAYDWLGVVLVAKARTGSTDGGPSFA